MDELERQRKEDFKEYEMKKRAEQDHKMQARMSETERAQYLQQLEQQRQRHNKHERLKHPGSRGQLEEAWANEKVSSSAFFSQIRFFFLAKMGKENKSRIDLDRM
ncbi:unnamed protein product [Gongylonema pulchrum]|uniref:BRD4_CDT domain-containing protein n=1 Tax=Gongylonema pulchrum TaxID=637853 RepID=A0A183DLJ9_9BILA|nr:unnamed protein product [Gongylonema pulchrum]